MGRFVLASLLVVTLLGVQANAQSVNRRIPTLTWGQDENTIFLSAVIPTPVEVNDVTFNDSHVTIDALGTEKEIPYFVEFELREDIQSKKSNWLVTRTGVKLVLKKAVPHRFDRLLSDPSAVPKHLIRVDWDEYMEEVDPIDQSKYPGNRIKLFGSSEDLEDIVEEKGTVVAWLNYEWCQQGVMKRWEYGELSVRVPDVPFVQIDTLRAKDLARKFKIMCDFDNFMLIYQRGEKLSPYKYHMNHNKTVAEAALKTYTAPLLTHLSEATWSSEVEKHLQTQVLPMPIIVAHFAETAPEIALLKEAAMTLRGKFRFFVAPPVAGEPRLKVVKSDDPDESVSGLGDDEEITAASIVQFARSRALPLLAKYIQESRFRYAEAGLPAGTVFLYEDEAGYAQYLNTSRATFLKIAKALRGKVSMYELDDLGGSDMKEYGLAPYMRPAFGIVTQMNDWVSPRYGFYDNTSLPLVSPGHEDQVVEWALDALAGKVDRDHKSNPVPFEHPFEPIQEIVARNWKKRVLNERNFSLMLTYHLGMQERMDYDKTKETLRRVSIALNETAPGLALVRTCKRTSDICQYATNENYVHLYPNNTDWYESPEQPREVGVYFFQGPYPNFRSARLTQKNVLRYGVLYVLRRAHELSGGAFDLAAAKAAVPAKAKLLALGAGEESEAEAEADGEDELEGPGGAPEPGAEGEEEAAAEAGAGAETAEAEAEAPAGAAGAEAAGAEAAGAEKKAEEPSAGARARIARAADAAKRAAAAAAGAKKEAEELGLRMLETKEKLEAQKREADAAAAAKAAAENDKSEL